MRQNATKRWLVRTALSVLAWLCPFLVMAQGWPANYGGVMLQGFYWDSYDDTKWTNLTSQADELSKYFDIIWVPNSGTPGGGATQQSMGYNPCFWLTHNTVFGTEAQLKTMINTFKAKGTTIMMDFVVNHKSGQYSWCDFPTELRDNYSIKWTNSKRAEICSTDECNRNGYTTTGAPDTGEDFDGCRDLDHTSTKTQTNIKTYIEFLVNELGYGGFRFDMVKGYSASYAGTYARHGGVQFNVGEYWDGDYNKVVNWINGTGKTLAAFDYPLKYRLNAAYGDGNWSALSDKGLAGDPNMSQYAVTFIDNHDTYQVGNSSRLNNQSNWLAANAFILGMPGTPCIMLPHWKMYKEELKKMIDARKAAGITNTSRIIQQGEQSGGYVIVTQGTKGRVMVACGYVADLDETGWTRVSVGNETNQNYGFYVNSEVGFDPSQGGGGSSTTEVPSLATWQEGKTFAYFEAPSSWSDVKAWAWDDNGNLTGDEWPGTGTMTKVGSNNGNNVWLWTAATTVAPTGLLFNGNNGADQTSDYTFTNGGYYTQSGLVGVVPKRGETGGNDNPDNDGTVKVYVKASAAPYIYAWEEGGGEISSAWPGDLMSQTETVDGVSFYVATFSKKTINIILNNGNGAQTADITGVTGTVYYEYDGNTTARIYDANGGGNDNPSGNVKVYCKANTAPYLYAWDEGGNPINGAWPGTVMSQTETVEGVTYFVKSFDLATVNIIFNNGNGAQTTDITGVTGTVFYEYDGNTTATKINDGGQAGGDLPGCATFQEGKTFAYLEAPTSWADVRAWAWGDNGNLTGDTWPGTGTMTQVGTNNGNNVWLWTADASVVPTGVVFNANNGDTQTSDYTFTNGGYYNTTSGLVGVVTSGGSQGGGDNDGTVKIYVKAEAAPYLYAWEEGGGVISGEWPGDLLSETETVGGETWYVKTYNKKLINIIFNNGNGGQTDDIKGISGTVYYQYDGNTNAVAVKPGQGGDEPTTDNKIKIYVKSAAGANIYAWTGSEDTFRELTATWPGDALSATETVNGASWYVKEFTADVVNVVLNSGEGAAQSQNFEGITADTFIEYDLATGDARITDGQSTETPTGNVTVYVKSSDTATYIYAWDDNGDLTAAWPGDLLSQTKDVNGEAWYYKTFDKATVNVVINNNGGLTQSADFKDITADTYIVYNPATGEATISQPGQGGEVEDGNINVYVSSPANIYAWAGEGDSFAELTSTWPGDELTQTKVVDGKTWYYTTFNKKPINIVLNSGEGAAQSSDIKGITKDIYINYDMETGEAVDVTDQVNPGGSGENKIPACAVYVDGKTFAYFEASNEWTNVNVWAWTIYDNFCDEWPGVAMTKVGTAANGNEVFQWIYDGDFEFLPENILFNNNVDQTEDFTFTNGGYYTASGLLGVVVKGTTPNGDLNGDGNVNTGDVSVLYNAILNSLNDSMYDLNGDGNVNTGDVSALYLLILGN